MLTSSDFQTLLADYKEYYNYIKARRELRDLRKAFDDRDYLKEKLMAFANKHVRVDNKGTTWKDVMSLKKVTNYNPNKDREVLRIVPKKGIDGYSGELKEEELITGLLFFAAKLDKKSDIIHFVDSEGEEINAQFDYKFKYAKSFYNRIMSDQNLNKNGELNIEKLEMIFSDFYDKDINDIGYKDGKTQRERLSYFYKRLAHTYFLVPSRKPGEERVYTPYLSGVPELMALLETKIRQKELALSVIFRDSSDIEKIKDIARANMKKDRDFNIGF